jgi:hypothetical protein
VSDAATATSRYNFLDMDEKLAVAIPNHVSVDRLAEIIAKESALTFSNLHIADYVKSGTIKNKTPSEPAEIFSQFVILGYRDGAPRLYRVYFYIDWNSLVFIGPIKILLYPDIEVSNYRVVHFGTQQAIADFRNGKSYAHEKQWLSARMQ